MPACRTLSTAPYYGCRVGTPPLWVGLPDRPFGSFRIIVYQLRLFVLIEQSLHLTLGVMHYRRHQFEISVIAYGLVYKIKE